MTTANLPGLSPLPLPRVLFAARPGRRLEIIGAGFATRRGLRLLAEFFFRACY